MGFQELCPTFPKRARQVSAVRLPHGHRPPPPCLHLLLFTALCFTVLETAAHAPRTGTAVEDCVAGVPGIMDTEVKDVSKQEPGSGVIALKEAMKYFDADFFNDSKLHEMEGGAKELNIPAFRENRKLVALENGGLHNPSVLIFKSSWSGESKAKDSNRFDYPHTSVVHRPSNDEDIAFMSIVELGELIRTKEITSRELTDVFLRRLKRYSNVLESVVTCTEDLAYKQAKEADDLLAQGKYLGPLHGIPYGLKDIIAVPQYNTTWGSKTFKNQVIDMEAFVYKRFIRFSIIHSIMFKQYSEFSAETLHVYHPPTD